MSNDQNASKGEIEHLEEGHRELARTMSDLSQEVSKGFAEVRGLISTVVAKLDAQSDRQARHERHVEKLEDELRELRERQHLELKEMRVTQEARIKSVEVGFESKLETTTRKFDAIQIKVWMALGGATVVAFITPIAVKVLGG